MGEDLEMKNCELCGDNDLSVSINCDNCGETNYWGGKSHIEIEDNKVYEETFDRKGTPSLNKIMSCTECNHQQFSVEYDSRYCIACNYTSEKIRVI